MQPTEANKLVHICAYSTSAAEWGQFVHLLTPVVALAARRVAYAWGDPSNGTVQEIVQEVFLKLCEDDRRILRNFEDRGNDSFLKLIRLVAASVATDHFRRVHADKRGGHSNEVALDALPRAEEIADGTAEHAVEWSTLMAQLDGLLRRYPAAVSMRDRNMFWMYYRHGLTAEGISRLPGIGLTPKGVESALMRLVRLLRSTLVEGKPDELLPEKKSVQVQKVKGFPRVIAIDSVKRR